MAGADDDRVASRPVDGRNGLPGRVLHSGEADLVGLLTDLLDKLDRRAQVHSRLAGSGHVGLEIDESDSRLSSSCADFEDNVLIV